VGSRYPRAINRGNGACAPSHQHRVSPRTIGNGKPALGELLERQRLSRGMMWERDWRQLYIRGKTPEEAARQAETSYWNTRPAFERLRKR
jgi:hypothetical protein